MDVSGPIIPAILAGEGNTSNVSRIVGSQGTQAMLEGQDQIFTVPMTTRSLSFSSPKLGVPSHP